jgi:hypothetical protein
VERRSEVMKAPVVYETEYGNSENVVRVIAEEPVSGSDLRRR